jgi:hypothetical protein
MLSFARQQPWGSWLLQTWTYHFQAVSFRLALRVFLPKNVIVRLKVVVCSNMSGIAKMGQILCHDSYSSNLGQ